jgi:hypothetical protein
MAELHPPSAPPSPHVLQGLVFKKAIGFLVGAVGNGLIAGMFLPWLQGENRGIVHLQLSIPVIIGAMVGGGLAGGTIGWLGWSLVSGTFAGTVLAIAAGGPTGAGKLIQGAVVGGLVGLVAGVVLEEGRPRPARNGGRRG